MNAETMTGVQKAGVKEDRRAGKYLTFRLGDEEYGLEILKVREIIGLMDITHIPRTPEFVRGVINLRGKVIPVIDTRLKFGMKAIGDTAETCIIVVEVKKGGESIEMGILVDAVSEVLDINGADIEDTPEFGAGLDTQFILGMAKAKGSVKILLDLDKVLTAEEILTVATTVKKPD
ncbi:MAG: chemotaxis protein CheW [Fibrobacterota bacterium]